MYSDPDLRYEVLSTIFGRDIKPISNKKLGGKLSPKGLTFEQFFIKAVLHALQETCEDDQKVFFADLEEFFDPDYDYDFTHLSDSSACSRGDELYARPKGWYRMALKVKGKYPDGDTWLGTKGWRSQSAPGEWPVSYHGTSLDGAKGIIKSHYKAGKGKNYGRGIYSTPDVSVAESENYAKTFTSNKTGKKYKVILQNRINKDKRKICSKSDYWLIPVEKGTSAEEEKRIVEEAIRPYGILIREA